MRRSSPHAGRFPTLGPSRDSGDRRGRSPRKRRLPWLTIACLMLAAGVAITTHAVTTHAADTSAEQGSEEGPMPITEVEGISEYRLANGVRVLLFPDPSKEVVTVNMTVFVGSRHEGYGEAGMAHLLEHMLFKGTPSHPNVPQALQDRGANFNGTTWMDRTNYYATLPASDDNLEFAIRLEADRLVNSLIRGEDLESEMTVVRNEFERGENSPFRVLMQRIQSTAYDWHNYGQSTIGNRSDIERVPVVKLREFYRKFYRPDNVMVVVAGKFDPEQALGWIEQTFGALAAPSTPIDETYTTEPPQDGERTVVVRRVADIQLAGAAYHIPAGSHPDYAAARALTYILGDEPSGRLYRGMVEADIATDVYTIAYAFREPGLFMALAEVPKEASIEAARQSLVDLIEQSFRDNPVTDEEVERARQKILKSRELEAAETDRLAVALSDWAAQGDWRLYFLFRDRVEQLTADQVQQFAEKYFTRNNRTVGLFIPSEQPERVTVPDAPDLIATLEGYTGREGVTAGEAFDPDPLAIEGRVLRGDLVGGIRYAMLPKKSRGGSVSLMLTLRFGSEASLDGRVAAIDLLGPLMARGTQRLDYQQLRDELTRLRAEWGVDSTTGLVQLRVKSKRESLAELIDLLAEVVRQPGLRESELEVIRRQTIASLEQSSSEPNALAPRAARRQLSPYGPENLRYVPTIEEEMARYRDVTIDQIRELHAEFLGNQAGEFAIVGDFDPEEVRERMADALDGWASDRPYERVGQPPHPEIPGTLIAIPTPDKANALLYSGQQYSLSDDTPEYASLVLGNFILGGGSLSSRLGDRVRQQEGLSYGVRSGITPRAKDARVDFVLYAITNPQNKDRLLGVIREEIDRLRSDGVTEDELRRAKESYLQSQRVSRTQDDQLAGLLVGGMFNDRTLEAVARQEGFIREATLESVNRAIQDFINPDELVIAVAGDFDAAEPSADDE